MARFLAVRDFDRLQHYRDRALRWIKLYLDLLDDWAFQKLPDESKFHLIGLMLLAGRKGNRLPNDADYLARNIGANTPIDLDLLLHSGFLVPIKRKQTKGDRASRTVAETEQAASPDKKRKEERRSEENKSEVECIREESGKDGGPGEGEEREFLQAQERERQAQEAARLRQEIGERIGANVEARQEPQRRDWVTQSLTSASEESGRRKSEGKHLWEQ